MSPSAEGEGLPAGEPSRPVRRRPSHPLPAIRGYDILGVIARGATGTVYRARQRVVERDVALKVLHPEAAARGRIVKRLQREARTTARLAHPHIVSAIDMGVEDGLWWFAMELVDGPSLALLLRQSGRLSEREALRLFIPLCEALVHMADHGVVHRDIKPANILVDSSGGARLADLGLAFTGDDPVLTAQGGTLGTPHYISPEQAREASSVDSRADVWSFGATLFHAVCGEPPFGGDSLAEVLTGVLSTPIPDPSSLRPDLSRGLALVLRKCLSRDLERRYGDARELLADLERVRERRAPNIAARDLEPVQREESRLLPVAAIAVVGALALGGGYAWWVNGGADPVSGAVDSPGPVGLDPGVARLYEEARADSSLLAAAYQELLAYRTGAPAELVPLLRDHLSKLEADLRRELRALRGELSARVASRLGARDLAEARRLVEEGLGAELALRTGFSLDELPPEARASQRRFELGLETELERSTSAAVEVVVRAVEDHYERFVLPEVERLEADRAFASALELLALDPSSLTREAGLDAEGLPQTDLADALAPLRARRSVRRGSVLDAWTRLDSELVRWIGRRADRLEEDVRERRLPAGAAEELVAAFERKLAAELVRRDEIPQPDSAGCLRELEHRRTELSTLEDRLLADELERRAQLLDTGFRELWGKRDYETLLFLWGDLERELRELPGDAERPWRRRLEERARLAVREAELLDELFDRVRGTLLELDGEVVELHLGSIRLRGELDVEVGPRELSVALVFGDRRRPVSLAELSAEDAVRLAFGDGRRRNPRERLATGLLHFREGRADLALAELRRGDPPADELDARLAAVLLDRAIAELDRERAVVADREEAALELLARIDSDRPGTYRLSALSRLLDDYLDVPLVRERAGELRALRRELVAPPRSPDLAAYERAFRPTAIEVDRDRLRLVYDFRDGGSPALDRGRFALSPEGLVAAQGGDAALPARVPARLALVRREAGLRVETGLSLRLDLVAPDDAFGLTVSALGFHVTLGAERWLADTGSLAEHALRLADGKARRYPRSLRGPTDGRLRVELELFPRSGRVVLRLGGGEDVMSPRPPDEVAETLALRATAGLRVERLELAAERD